MADTDLARNSEFFKTAPCRRLSRDVLRIEIERVDAALADLQTADFPFVHVADVSRKVIDKSLRKYRQRLIRA